MEKIIYNVTCKVEASFLEDWLTWMKKIHIPEVMETGYFTSYRLTRLIGDDNQYGITFAVQYEAPSMASYLDYRKKSAPSLQQKGKSFCGEKAVSFRSVLRILEES